MSKRPRGGWEKTGTAAKRSKKMAAARKKSFQARRPANLVSFAPEIKAIDVPNGVLSLNTGGAVSPINLIRTGNSFFNRVGRKVELKSVLFKGIIQPLRTVANQDYVRILIVYDRQTNGAAPNITSILQTVDQAGAATTSSWSDINLNNRDRYSILYDKRIYLPSNTDTAGVITNPGFTDPVSSTFNLKKFIPLSNMVTQYQADSAPAVIGDISTGSLYVATIGSLAAAAEGYQLQLETRVRFVDL